jgi:hypothetical protein
MHAIPFVTSKVNQNFVGSPFTVFETYPNDLSWWELVIFGLLELIAL